MRTRRRFFSDTTPLRESAQYRRLYFGQMFAIFGSQITVVAVPLQVYLITGSSLAVGLLGLAQLVPLLSFSLIGGAVADKVDRRKLLLWMQLSRGALGAGLVANALLPRPALWPLFVLTALQAGLHAVDAPARNASIPALVRRELLPAAAALHQILMQVGMVAGPALAGVIVARANLATAYMIELVSFAVAAAFSASLRPLPPGEGSDGDAGLFTSIWAGLRFLRGQKPLQGIFLADLNAMVFGMPRALFPALAAATVHVGPVGLGLLYAAPAAGALVAALSSGWVGGVVRQGAAVIASVIAWGAAIAVFGLVPGNLFWLALLLLAVAGAADVISAVFRNTIMQQVAPDSMRGRMSALHIAVVAGGPRLGDAESGLVASVTSVQFSVVSGGLVCIAGAAVLQLLSPALGRYRRPRPGPALPVPALED